MIVVGLLSALLSAAYLVTAVVVRRGTSRRALLSPHGATPTMSVVIAARDEEGRIAACLGSLRRQDYPDGRWEVVVVDDRSHDATGEIVRRMADGWPALRLVRIDACPPELAGKQHALAVGVSTTRGDIIAMTDADCTVPSDWLARLAGAFGPGVGVVAGLATLPPPRSAWECLQQADLDLLGATQWGLTGLGLALTASGNNLAVRREAYDAVGGYAALGRAIVEDCALVTRIARTARWRVRVVPPPTAAVTTEPLPTLGDFLHQRARWASAIRFLRGWRLAFLSSILAQRVAVLAATALWLGGALDGRWPLAAWLAWVLADACLIERTGHAFGHRGILRWSPAVTLWQAVYHPLVGFWSGLLRRRIIWKGQSYRC